MKCPEYITDLDCYPVSVQARALGYTSGWVVRKSSSALLSLLGCGLFLHSVLDYEDNLEEWKWALWKNAPELVGFLRKVKEMHREGHEVLTEEVWDQLTAYAGMQVEEKMSPQFHSYRVNFSNSWPLIHQFSLHFHFFPILLRVAVSGEFVMHTVDAPWEGLVVTIAEESDHFVYLLHRQMNETKPNSEFPFITNNKKVPVANAFRHFPLSLNPSNPLEIVEIALSILQSSKKEWNSDLQKACEKYILSEFGEVSERIVSFARRTERHELGDCERFECGERVSLECGHSVHRTCWEREEIYVCPLPEKCAGCRQVTAKRDLLLHMCSQAVCVHCLQRSQCPLCLLPLDPLESEWVSQRLG